MADQISFVSLDFVGKKKRTTRDVILSEMAAVVLWGKLEAVIGQSPVFNGVRS